MEGKIFFTGSFAEHGFFSKKAGTFVGNDEKVSKKICKNMEIITPGIRLIGDNKGDQKRVLTPKEAFENGATSIVMGRSITRGNIKKNIQKLIKSLN